MRACFFIFFFHFKTIALYTRVRRVPDFDAVAATERRVLRVTIVRGTRTITRRYIELEKNNKSERTGGYSRPKKTYSNITDIVGKYAIYTACWRRTMMSTKPTERARARASVVLVCRICVRVVVVVVVEE